MRRLLVDLNVVLDVLLDRAGHAEAAAGIWAAAEREQIEALIPAHGFPTVFHLTARRGGVEFARRALGDLLRVFRVAPVDEAVILRALTLPWRDFEHAVGAAAAEAAGCEAIVSRDPSGFPHPPVPVMDPAAALALLQREGGPDVVAEPGAPGWAARRPRRRRERRLGR